MPEPSDGIRFEADGSDKRLLEILDRYTDALHEENLTSRSVLLERHPELADLLRCLESLDSLAVPPIADQAESSADMPTLIGSDDKPYLSDSSDNTHDGPAEHETFGRYELLREIGRGGMGVVYLARQTDLDRLVAVKMILSSRLASDDDVRRFLAESKAAGRLRHPNIVGIHEAGQIAGQHYFAMDYVDGPSLAEWSRSHSGDFDKAAACVASVARAVHFLHQNGIVHRDLKPSNILLDHDGNPSVTDFGLARVFNADSRQTQTGTIIGTPSYMPPEQAAGKLGEISPRSDVYSLGAILYELITGRPPFQHDSPLDVLVEVLEGEPQRPCQLNPHVPRELELIVLKCLEKDPQKRYESADALGEDLERYLRREPVTARPSGIVQWFRRWGRREPALVSRLGGLLAAFTVVETRHLYNEWYNQAMHDTAYYLKIVAVLATWAVVSFLFQRLLHRERTADFARFGWAASDGILLTTVLNFADPPLGLLLIGYPLLVAAAGLFFRVRLVIFTTAVSLLAFVALMFLRPEEVTRPHYPVIFGATLIVIGFIVSYQVYRVRALSRYYDRRHVP